MRPGYARRSYLTSLQLSWGVKPPQTSMHKTLIAFFLLTSLIGCRRQPSDGDMPAGWCDSVPPPVAANARRPVRVPDVVSRSDQAAVVGTVTEAGTARPLESVISLRSDSASGGLRRTMRTGYTDSLGGFALTDIVPGIYTLQFRSVSHHMADQRLLLRRGATDTVRIELRFFTCIGF